MEVGDYVRTKNGYIDRIKKIEIEDHQRGIDEELKPYKIYKLKNDYFDKEYNETSCWVFEDFIKKSSPNIIDLIEVGDYVNNEKIVDIGCLTNGPEKGTKVIDYYIAPNTVYYLKNEDIKSIVTKEQFESMEYKVKE